MRSAVALLALLTLGCSRDAGEPPARPASGGNEAATATATHVTGRAPAGAIVMLEPLDAPAPMPEGPAVMDQFSKAFVPETLFVRVGQPVTFKNSEDQLHNVTVTRARTGAGVFNISQNQGDVYTHSFDQVGEYDVNCDVHPGMRATIIAASTPYATYVDNRRMFSLVNVPPGKYKLQVFAEGRSSDGVVDIAGATLDLGDVARGAARAQPE
jgi:plastocyanin